MSPCGWGACPEPPVGVAVPPVSSRRAEMGVCVGHVVDAERAGWGLRLFRGRRCVGELVCRCASPAVLDGQCQVCLRVALRPRQVATAQRLRTKTSGVAA